MSDSEAKPVSPEPTVLADGASVKIEGVGVDVEVCVDDTKSKPATDLLNIKETTVRTHTVIIDATSTSTDVGVQATPAAVSADLQDPSKQQRGILAVTSDMRNCAAKNSRNQTDNHHSVTNTKEKTPMCLINELARFNKLAHKYVLVDEEGPAHKKEFKIRLDLGSNECYHATGTSIKRAQHAAAEIALSITKLNKPVCKPRRRETPPPITDEKKTGVVTPTVQLNALAMKLGEHAEYVNIDPPPVPHIPQHYYYQPMSPDYHSHHSHHHYHPHHHRMPHHMYANSYLSPHYRPRMSQIFSVLLRIGRHEFRGQGTTRQLARHNAANRALKVLANIPLQRRVPEDPKIKEEVSSPTIDASDSPTPPTPVEQPDPDAPAAVSSPIATPTPSDDEHGDNGSNKSEISLVHEMALHIDKTITFDIIHESGPPHMRNFVTRCVCGDLTSEGEGNSKKKSKKKAAAQMLAKLEALNPPLQASKQKVKNVANKKKNRNLIKMQKANVEYGSGINPISRLIQIQQANKRKEPVYSLVMEHGLPRRREFIIQVDCNDRSCQGKGPNKKLAKRNAAEEMLQLMGYSQPSPSPGKSVLKSPDHSGNSSATHNKHVTFLDSTQINKLPGVLVRQDNIANSSNQEMPPFKADLAASLAKELLEKGKSAVGETLLPAKEHPKYPLRRPLEQLEYLVSCMGISIDFTDFPKGTNNTMCLTLVSLQTNPTQVFHGSGTTVDDSHDKAALQALNKLAQTTPCEKESVADDGLQAGVTAGGDAAGGVAAKPTTNGEVESVNVDNCADHSKSARSMPEGIHDHGNDTDNV